MIVEPIVKLITDAGLGVAGQTVFAHYMSADIKTGIVVLSNLSGNKIDYELPNWRSADPFRVVVRAPSIAVGKPLCDAINKVLVTTTKKLLVGTPNLLVAYIRMTSDPIVYPRQIGNLWEISSNFAAAYAVQS